MAGGGGKTGSGSQEKFVSQEVVPNWNYLGSPNTLKSFPVKSSK